MLKVGESGREGEKKVKGAWMFTVLVCSVLCPPEAEWNRIAKARTLRLGFLGFVLASVNSNGSESGEYNSRQHFSFIPFIPCPQYTTNAQCNAQGNQWDPFRTTD
jgi:hypothetical protein